MYIYADLIWLLNACIDYLLLWLTALFRRAPVSRWRLALAACIGSSYVLVVLYPDMLPYVDSFVTKLLVSVLMIWVAFGFQHVQPFFTTLFTFYFIVFVTGGGMFAMHYLMQSPHAVVEGVFLTNNGGFGDPLAWWFVAIGFPFVYWFSRNKWRRIEQLNRQASFFTSVRIGVNDQTMDCIGLIDTGNQLTAPFTGEPVIIVEQSILEGKLPDDVLHVLSHPYPDIHTKVIHKEWQRRLRYIPFQAVGSQSNMMVAFQPDYVKLSVADKTAETDQVLIGVRNGRLDGEGRYAAIIHPELLCTSSE